MDVDKWWFCRECACERPGRKCWRCGTELKPTHPNWDPVQTPEIEPIRKLAMEYGYCIAVHGSLQRDLDLVAVAWDEKALQYTYADLMHHIAQGIGGRVIHIEAKPLGRHACTIQPPGWTKNIDLSVAPFIYRKESHASAPQAGSSDGATRPGEN